MSTNDYLDAWMNPLPCNRQMVKLKPNEIAPDCLHYPPPTEGYRWENDEEFRKRIHLSLPQT